MKLWGKILLILILIVLVIWGIVGLLQIRLLKSIEKEIERGDKAENRENEAKFWFEKGKKFYFSGDYDKAIKYFTRAIEIKPNNPEFYRWRSMVYYSKGTRIYLKDYNNPIAIFLKRLEKKKYLNKAIEDLEEATDYNPFDAYYFEELGKKYYIIGEYGSVIAKFERAIKLKSSKNYTYPSRSFLYFLCGRAYFKKGDYKEAINSFTKAIDLFPHSFYYEERGKAYYKIGEFHKAVKDFIKAINLEENERLLLNRNLFRWFAKALYADGSYEIARIVLTDVIELKPDDAEYYNLRGMVYLQEGMYEKAVEDFTKAITYGGWNFIYYQNRGEAYKRMGLKNKARIDFIKAKILKFLKFFDIWEKLERDEIKQRQDEIRDLDLYVKFRISDIERELAKKEEERKIKKIQKQLYSWGNKDLEEWMKNEKKWLIMRKKELERREWEWKQMMKEFPLIIKQLNER
jgi:tetratricopeptide (TPR) repeat protein